jgi:hypothetical protein
MSGTPPSVSDYLTRIGSIRLEGVESLLRRGEVLIEAKERLPHGQWKTLCAQLPFSERHAHRLRSIASHPVLVDRTSLSCLPDDLVSLYLLSRLPADLVRQAMKDGRIHPRMSVADAKALAGKESQREAGQSREKKASPPWTLDGAIRKVRAIIAPCPSTERTALAWLLRGLADRLAPDLFTAPSSRGPRGKPDPRLLNELITFALRAAVKRWHPDNSTGNAETMKAANLAIEWLRAQAGGSANGGRRR